jgi:hypothetical protein
MTTIEQSDRKHFAAIRCRACAHFKTDRTSLLYQTQSLWRTSSDGLVSSETDK